MVSYNYRESFIFTIAMKKSLSIMSLIVLVLTEIVVPTSWVFADTEEEVIQEEIIQDSSVELVDEIQTEEPDNTVQEQTEEEVIEETVEETIEDTKTEEKEDIVPAEPVTDEDVATIDNNVTEEEEWIKEVEDLEIQDEKTENEDTQEIWEETSESLENIEEAPDEVKIEEINSLEEMDLITEEFQTEQQDNLNYVPWEVIVKYKDAVPEESTPRFLARSEVMIRNFIWLPSSEVSLIWNDLEIVEELTEDSTVLVEIKDDKTIDETIELLKEDPRVDYVEPNYIHQMFDTVSTISINDANKSELQWLDLISWADAYMLYSWYLKSENTSVIVGVIDNGVNYNHPDLTNSMWNPSTCKIDSESVECNHWYDFLYNNPTPLPNISSHGTHVAGIIWAEINNGKGIVWVNPHSKIASLKAGNWALLTSVAEVRAIKFAKENGIKIINASYGSEAESQFEKEAIQDFWKAGGLFIAAAGNDSQDVDENKVYPCAYDLDNIICVASVSNDNNLSYFSNYWATTVDIFAPWERILSTSINEYQNQALLDENFDNSCTEENQNLDSWIWGSCRRWGNWEYAYKFNNSLTSPLLDFSTKENVYLSFSIACNHKRGVNLDFDYSNDGENYNSWLEISSVGAMWYSYSINIHDYINNKFAFRLKLQSPMNWLYCVIDNVAIYQDPYYSESTERYVKMSWTSMATPFVSWLASLVWKLNPNLSNIEVKNIILWTGDDIESIPTKTVTWRKINVLKTLNSVTIPPLASPNWLRSSWNWKLAWNPIVEEWEITYHYEVFDDNAKSVASWTTQSTWVQISNYSEWNYSWVLKASEWGRKSEIVTWYICKKPELTPVTFTSDECAWISWAINLPKDNCSLDYTLNWVDENNNQVDKYAISNTPWELVKKVYLENLFWEKTESIDVKYIWNNSPLRFDNQSVVGFWWKTITSTSQQSIWNAINIFWVTDWLCWSWTVNTYSVSCNAWEWILKGNELSIKAPSSGNWKVTCIVKFKDDEWQLSNATFTYSYNTKTTNTTNNSSNNSSSNNSSSNNSSSNNSNNSSNNNSNKSSNNNSSSNNTSSPNTSKEIINTTPSKNENYSNDFVEIQEPWNIELFSAPNTNDIDFSWYNYNDPKEVLPNNYTVEMNNAYEFAHRLWITTTDSIENANMEGELTRIAMAKMLSQYAINVLWLRPNLLKKMSFSDVDEELNEKYGNWVSLSYQLWIMWVWIKNFRPYDTVTRAEFATALSRMLYWLKDWADNYYSTHIEKLNKEWIIWNTDPDLQELRGYVMLMLMRSAKR